MKTSVEISDPLFQEARRVAARSKTTLRDLIERGLRLVIAEERGKPFVPRDASVDGDGLNPEFEDADWAAIRAAIYDGHGG